LATMSLLIDHVFTAKDGESNAQKSVEKVLRKNPLLPIANVPKEQLFEFEKSLIARSKAFIAMLIAGHNEELTPRCKFMTSLKQLTPELVLSKAKAKWVRAVEKYCQQRSWGGPLVQKHAAVEVVFLADENQGDASKPSVAASAKKKKSKGDEFDDVFDDDCTSDEDYEGAYASKRNGSHRRRGSNVERPRRSGRDDKSKSKKRRTH
jgi:hypothetical protein